MKRILVLMAHPYPGQSCVNSRMSAMAETLFLPPLVLFSSLLAGRDDRAWKHVACYRQVLEALRDEHLDIDKALGQEFMNKPTLPLLDSGEQHPDGARG